MAPPVLATRRPLHPPPRALGRLAIAFVFLSMAALVLVPFVVQARVDALREALDHDADPARTHVARVQFALSREIAALHRYLGGGDPAALRSYDEARVAEAEAMDSLRVHARALGPEVLEPFVRLETLAREWQARLGELGPMGAGAAGTEGDVEPALLEAAVHAAEEVDAAIQGEVERKREVIHRTVRTGRILTLLLGGLALGAAGTVAWLYRRLRGTAALAEARQAEAERALHARERAIEARARLLRGVTHDVKNPLGAAQGYAELLEMGLKGPLTVEQSRYVAGIRRSIDGALAILADLLDLARADGGGLRVERLPVDVRAIAAEALEEHRSSAEATGHAVELRASAEAVALYTDPDRVRQVLGNLLSNAVKYTPQGGRLDFTVALRERAGRRCAAVDVADTGTGIPADQQKRLFLEFTRLDPEAAGGAGLGLAISQRIAHLLGGEITVQSQAGEGSTFTLWLPAESG
jgi:signal transduction histidine kinase